MATVGDLLVLAVRHHQSSNLEQAEPLYLEIMEVDPNHADAHHLLGLLWHQTGRQEEAVRLVRQAIDLNPSAAVFHFNLGTILKDQGKLGESAQCFRRALGLNPSYVDALGNLGIVLKDLGQIEEAVACYRQALRLDPHHAKTLNNLGTALQEQGHLSQAAECFREALRLDPQFAIARCNLGVVLRAEGHFPEAIQCFRDALVLDPQNVEVHSVLGQALKEQGQPADAARHFRQALQLEPKHADARYYLSHVFLDQGHLEEAAECFGQAARLRPGWVDAFNNLGVALQYLGRLDEAEHAYDEALRHQPEHASARLNLSLLRLLNGDFLAAWPDYEYRWKLAETPQGGVNQAQLGRPSWDGSPLEGKTILLYAEQGLGDTIQFIRYAPLVKQCGGNVLVTCPPALRHLLEGMAGIDQLWTESARLPPFDVQTPILRLPGLFRTLPATIPADIPYLYADPTCVEHWRQELLATRGLKVGIAWQGSVTHKGDHYRSISLAHFEGLAKVDGVDLVSLQVGAGTQQLEGISFPVSDLGNRFDRSSLDDLAAVIANLDLVITVDTAAAHLAGALGAPVWVLLPFAPDWRWLLERADSPWYPTMRLFRQRRIGEWDEVFERLTGQLSRLLAARQEQPGKPIMDILRDLYKEEDASIPAAVSRPGTLLGPTESERRKQTIARKQTDVERWQNPAQLESAWNRRAQFAADLVPAGASVLDLGCGNMALERLLPAGCTYVPCDVVQRDQRTLVCDFNAGEFPVTVDFTHLVVLGVLEYLYDVPAFLRKLRSSVRPVVISYNPADLTYHLDRPALGWVNHLSLAELERALDDAGLGVTARLRIDGNQVLVRLAPDKQALPHRTVLVVSACNVGNFGDRLGYHLINEVLPAHATVYHATMDFQEGCRIEPVPAVDYDLLVLGIGNSLFGPMLNDDLLRLLERVPRAIGIFGTQYRQQLDRGRLEAVLDRLQTWYARFEEDVLLYGKGRGNVVHLGDWLISAFPLARGQNPDTLTIGREVRNNLPLDRTIQQIQSYRKVFSPWLHTLLCAFTSAEEVAYREQREAETGLVSGKFRSLLIDVFGRAFPEEQFFEVDRDRVAAYKVKVQKGMTELRQSLFASLTK